MTWPTRANASSSSAIFRPGTAGRREGFVADRPASASFVKSRIDVHQTAFLTTGVRRMRKRQLQLLRCLSSFPSRLARFLCSRAFFCGAQAHLNRAPLWVLVCRMEHLILTARISGAIALAIVLGTGVSASTVFAQSLINPDAAKRPSSPPTSAKSEPARRENSCTVYGAGFVNIPGTDGCVKIGGYVEGTATFQGR
jgi:hypothetical protein